VSILRYQMTRPCHWSVLIAVVPFTVAFLAIAFEAQVHGHNNEFLVGGAIVVLIVGLMRLRDIRRVQARAATFVPYRVESSAELAHSPAAVWSLIMSTDEAPRLSPELVSASHVAGTPHGVGERQTLVRRDGRTSVVEVVEVDEGRRVVSVTVRPRLPVRLACVYEIEPQAEGCLLRLAFEVDLPPGGSLTPPENEAWRQDIDDYLQRVRTTLSA
jgi:hypothetical protein